MWDYVGNHLGEISSLFSVCVIILGAIFWSHRKLHNDIQEIREDIRFANGRIDSSMGRIDACLQRIDDTNKRIDRTYDILMKIVTK